MEERIEEAIETINGLLMDFSDALDGLRGIRELLYEIQEGKISIDENAPWKNTGGKNQ
jgi:hypothetical protein